MKRNHSCQTSGMISAALLALGLTFAGSSARAAPPVGKPAPAFALKRLDGPSLPLTALRGKVVFLDFWGPS